VFKGGGREKGRGGWVSALFFFVCGFFLLVFVFVGGGGEYEYLMVQVEG